uniref:Putative ovule protein n=1 Tax=Solanum chacoense TaxID=4108 RepID=A0A0V0H889_SOLCH
MTIPNLRHVGPIWVSSSYQEFFHTHGSIPTLDKTSPTHTLVVSMLELSLGIFVIFITTVTTLRLILMMMMLLQIHPQINPTTTTPTATIICIHGCQHSHISLCHTQPQLLNRLWLLQKH